VIGAKAPIPDFIEPALATSIERVPSGDRWVHEIKFDGYGVQVHLKDANVKVFTRTATTGTTASRRSPTTHARRRRVRDHRRRGRRACGQRAVLQNELKFAPTRSSWWLSTCSISTATPYESCRSRSGSHIEEAVAKTDIQFSGSFEVDGPEMFAHVCGIGLEGVVSKVRDSRYASSRGIGWVKKT
jgi:bifunctional non-homologous end joining protein LigD